MCSVAAAAAAVAAVGELGDISRMGNKELCSGLFTRQLSTILGESSGNKTTGGCRHSNECNTIKQ